MHSVALRAVIILPICIICFSLLFFPLYYAGYVSNSIWNHYAEQTTCTITGHNIQPNTCSYKCYPYEVCTGSGTSRSCITEYETCYYPCYDGYYIVMWLETYSTSIYVDTDEFSVNVQNYLNNYYPIGNTFTCYYNTRDPSDMRLTLANPEGFFIAAMFFSALFILIIVVWLVCEIVLVIKRNWIAITEFTRKLFCCGYCKRSTSDVKQTELNEVST